MKISLSNSIFFIFIIISVSSCCKNNQHQSFFLSDKAKSYIPDTCDVFYMIDNFGITEQFRLNNTYNLYTNQQYELDFLTIYRSEPDKCNNYTFIEKFSIGYISSPNRFFFEINIDADIETNSITIIWNQDILTTYTFETKEIIYQEANTIIENNIPEISFIDNLEIQDSILNNVMCINFSKVENTNTPSELYIAPNIGLVKYILRNNAEAVRIF